MKVAINADTYGRIVYPSMVNFYLAEYRFSLSRQDKTRPSQPMKIAINDNT